MKLVSIDYRLTAVDKSILSNASGAILQSIDIGEKGTRLPNELSYISHVGLYEPVVLKFSSEQGSFYMEFYIIGGENDICAEQMGYAIKMGSIPGSMIYTHPGLVDKFMPRSSSKSVLVDKLVSKVKIFGNEKTEMNVRKNVKIDIYSLILILFEHPDGSKTAIHPGEIRSIVYSNLNQSTDIILSEIVQPGSGERNIVLMDEIS